MKLGEIMNRVVLSDLKTVEFEVSIFGCAPRISWIQCSLLAPCPFG